MLIAKLVLAGKTVYFFLRCDGILKNGWGRNKEFIKIAFS
jgi:hypothetical protein